MASFFEKLKKGMGVEEPMEESIEKPAEKVAKQVRKPRLRKAAEEKVVLTVEQNQKPAAEEAKPIVRKLEIKAIPITEEDTEEKTGEEVQEQKWFEPEGQLAIDIFQTETDLIIQSAIAGVKPENLDISMEKDIITIKGIREKPTRENGDYFAQECYWGPFSREVILPVEVDPNRTKAEMREGILIIKIPKIFREKRRRIVVTS